MKQYKVIRSYHNGEEIDGTYLDEAFKEGWQFERASEYIPHIVRVGGEEKTFFGYIEYILSKETPETSDSTMSRITTLEGGQYVPEEWVKTLNALGYEICTKEAVEVAREAIELKKQTEVILEEEEYGEYVQDRIFDLYGKKQRNEKKCCVTCKYLKIQPSEAPCDRCKFRNKWEANDVPKSD